MLLPVSVNNIQEYMVHSPRETICGDINLNQLKRIKTIQNTISDHKGIKLEFSNTKVFRNMQTISELNKIPVNILYIKDEIITHKTTTTKNER